MSKITKIVTTIVISIVGMLFLAGCSAKEIPEKVNLVIIGGPRANINRISMDSAAINDLLYDASYSYGSVTFITCDGKPRVYAQVDIPEPSVKGMDETALKKRANDYTEQLKQLLDQGTAQYPESDLLTATQLASQAFADADSNSKCILTILDSGLSTVKLDFRQQVINEKGTKPQYMLSARPDSIVSELQAESEIPNLNHAQIYFSYCGATAYPQEPLSEKQKGQLRDIWESIFMAGNASEVIFTNDFATDMPYDGLPIVSTVPVEEMNISPETDVIETIVLDEESVRFKGDKAEYIDQDAANSVLKEVAELLIECPESTVYLVGTTATGARDYTQDLSERRSQTVRSTLIEFGVPEDRLISIGFGCSNYWHIADVDDTGHHIEEYACQNRAVRIIDVNSADGEIVRKELERR